MSALARPPAVTLDTCAVIYSANGDPMARSAVDARGSHDQASRVHARYCNRQCPPALPLHGDPADRLLVATARHLGMPIVTRDRQIAAYAAAGYIQVIGC